MPCSTAVSARAAWRSRRGLLTFVLLPALDDRDYVRPQHLAQHLFLLAKGGDRAIGHGKHEGATLQRARPVGDDDDNAAALAYRQDRLGQGGVAFGVEIRVRLVENHDERL